MNEIELDGKIYVAKEVEFTNDCHGCAFRENSVLCLENPCFHGNRSDGRNVIFVGKKEGVQVNKEGKKGEFKLPDSMKIWCATKEYATKVQEKLSAMGCKWVGGDTRVWHPPMNESGYAIYCCNGRLTYGTARDYLEDQEIDEYILDETLTTCFVKVPKENGEDVGIDSISLASSSNSPDSFDVAGDKVSECVDIKPDTIGLDCLFNQIVLLQKETDSLSEQKEQIVNKISANTQDIDILKEKMQDLLSQVGLVFVGADNSDVVKDEDLLSQLVEPAEPAPLRVGLTIIDWRNLKIGDIVNIYGEDSRVCAVEQRDYKGDYAFAVGCIEDDTVEWVDTSCHDWRFVRRPK